MADTAGPARPARARPRWVDASSLVALALVVLATVPLLASALRIGPDWVPQGDNAILALRGDDLFTSHTPLLGMPSTVSGTVGEAVHHPGPLESQAIGILAAVTDDVRAPLVAVTLVNLVSVVVVLGWARRIGGRALLAVAGPVVAALLWSLRGPVIVTPFNPYAAVLPYLAALASLVAAWARMPWGATLAVLFGSWAAQAHLTTSGPVLAATGATVVVAGIRWARERRQEGGGWPDRRRMGVGLACAAGCWALPLYEAATNRGGNLRALLHTSRALGGETLGPERAVHVVVNALSLRPVWAQAGAGPLDLVGQPTLTAYAGAAALGAVAVGVAVRYRREQPAITAGVVLALASLIVGGALTSKIPSAFANVFAVHNYFWLWPAGALLWVSTVVGLGRMLVAWGGGDRRWATGPALAAPLVVGLLATAALAIASVGEPHRGLPPTSAYVRALRPAVLEALDPERAYLVDVGQSFEEFDLSTGLLVALERAGLDVRVPVAFEQGFGSHRVDDAAGRATVEVRASRGPAPPRPGAVVVATYEPSRDLVARHARAEDDLVREVAARGGVTLGDGRRIAPEDARAWVEAGGFAAAADFRILDPALARSSAAGALMDLHGEPLLVMTVYLVEEGTPTPVRGGAGRRSGARGRTRSGAGDRRRRRDATPRPSGAARRP